MAHRSPDLLRWRGIGAFLRWRHTRTSLQLALLAVAAVIVLHGLFGPQVAPSNLATVLTWVHYRGLLVVGLLAAGNLFCTGCPLVLVRDAGRRLRAPVLRWPRWLRTKWVGVALVVLVLFAYELFDLWALPRATAWLVLGCFGAALLVDLLFTGATFCKFLCPVGQFSFLTSTLSPLELRVHSRDVCRSCRTADCIRGRRDPATHAVVQRGCELALFLPSKVGNLDCTLCLDCVQACPHDNIALTRRVPGLELADPERRSGIGLLSRRPDMAALVIVFVFGGLVNAFGMVSPARASEQWIRSALGVQSEAAVLGMLFVIGLVVAPVMLLSVAAGSTAWLAGGRTVSVRQTTATYVYALVPFGAGMWLAHYGFHLLTGALTIVPVVQSAALDAAGRPVLGTPLWRLAGMRPGAVFPFEVGVILTGAIGSMGLAYLISDREHPRRVIAATIPWAVVTIGLAACALWILSQPMEIRGLGVAG